jgi:hypothetical protein
MNANEFFGVAPGRRLRGADAHIIRVNSRPSLDSRFPLFQLYPVGQFREAKATPVPPTAVRPNTPTPSPESPRR